jgi:molecular chaperone IbpA
MLLKEDMVMRLIDLSPLTRSTIGFDRMFDLIETAAQFDHMEGYPPYNIEKTGEDTYRITLAVAGFTADELVLTAQPNQLIVAGRRTPTPRADDAPPTEYLYQGIANRAFQRSFNLADYVTVTGASLVNGLLTVELKRELPDSVKPRRIEIGAPASPAIEGKLAA